MFGCQSLEFSHVSSDLVGRTEEAKGKRGQGGHKSS